MIRKINTSDHLQIIKILKDIQEDGDSYFFENMSDNQLIEYWIKENFDGFVYEEDKKI